MPSAIFAQYTPGSDFGPDGLLPATAADEANHRIANNLAMVAGLVRLQAAEIRAAGRSLTAEEVGLIFGEVSSRLGTVAEFHRLLAREAAGDVHLSDYLRDVGAAAIASMAPAGQVDLQVISQGACMMPGAQALHLGLIVGELVTNAVKYAHPAAGVRGSVQITCHGQEDGGLVVSVTDDGVGLPEGFDPQRDGGLGMRVVKNLAKQLSATLSFHSTSLGLTTRLRIVPSRATGGSSNGAR